MNTSKKKYKIAVSCIGSGVGQSVITSLRLSRLPVKTIGLGYNPFAFGAYDCDRYDYTLSIYHENYVDNLIEVCLRNEIDLLIPGLDDEVMVLANNEDKLREAGIKVILADKQLVTICREKERMEEELSKVADVFVRTYNRVSLHDDIKSGKVKLPLIAKPRGGFASRGIKVLLNLDDLNEITDDHIIQELAMPARNDPNYNYYIGQINKKQNTQVAEVSIQVVYSPDGNLMGRMFSYNKLNNGVPIEIVPYENQYVWEIVDKLTPELLRMGLRGPLNIQGRITDNGLKLFEMNPRFTGITGLRALMGFNEVEACVKEWLGIDKGMNNLHLNYKRFGTRQVTDKSIPVERNPEVAAIFKKLNGDNISDRKTVLITGACGYLGHRLITNLVTDNTFNIWAFDLDKKKTEDLFRDKTEAVYDYDDYLKGRIHMGNIDLLVHLGFTRPHGTNEAIADSLRFTNELFARATTNNVPAIINISSQSVYGQESPTPWTETSPTSPDSAYAQAKYSTELLLYSLGRTNNVLKYTSLRLGTLAGPSPGMTEVDLLSKLARNAYDSSDINIIHGMQMIQRFDIRDAVDAIIALMKTNTEKWKPVYNLSSGEVLRLIEIAERIIKLAAEYNGGKFSRIQVEEKEIRMIYNMDSSLFYEDMNWTPRYTIDDTIKSLVEFFHSKRGEKV